MDKYLVIFTMKGCPHCSNLKELFDRESIPYTEYDIHEQVEEYDYFTKATKNEYIPAFLIFRENGDKEDLLMFAPERDFNTMEEAVNLAKTNLGLQ
jgi:glutaredoxin